MKRKLPVILLVVLMATGFFYRIYGLNNNFSFWTDEEHVAIFARAILEHGRPALNNGYSTGVFQYLQYWLTALSALVFGLNEFGIRFPSVIFGVLTIAAVYFVGKDLFGPRVGLIAAFLTTFLKIEILWSRQARPYQALQFFCLLAAWFLFRLSRQKRFVWTDFLGFLISGILGVLMHGLGLLIFLAGGAYIFITRPRWWREIVLFFVVPLVIAVSLFWNQIRVFLLQLGEINNVFYYRVFLTHNYWFLVFLGLLGLTCLVYKKERNWQLPFLFLSIQGVVLFFFLRQPFVRYFYIVFPFLILLAAVGLERLVRLRFFSRSAVQNIFLLLFLALLLLVAKRKFAFLPQTAYSVNEDMQEIPEVNWNQVYGLVKKILAEDKETILITNWSDLPFWYLGEGKLNYLARVVPAGETAVDPITGVKIIPSLDEFKRVTAGKKVVVVFDSWDNYLPGEIRDYVEKNFKKELTVDKLYQIQPRYWPVSVYLRGRN